jgi:hypothetical protein
MCLQIARSANLPVIFNAGGTGIPIPQEFLKCVTILTPNESEVAQFTGMPTNTWEQTIKATAKIQSWWFVLLLQDMDTCLIGTAYLWQFLMLVGAMGDAREIVFPLVLKHDNQWGCFAHLLTPTKGLESFVWSICTTRHVGCLLIGW